MKFVVVLALLAVVVLADPPLPQFPIDWSGYTTNQLVQNQGNFISGGAYCCNPGTNCQVQIQYQAGQSYLDHAGNRTRQDGDQGNIITLFSEQKGMSC
jgi:hypothetical protein